MNKSLVIETIEVTSEKYHDIRMKLQDDYIFKEINLEYMEVEIFPKNKIGMLVYVIRKKDDIFIIDEYYNVTELHFNYFSKNIGKRTFAIESDIHNNGICFVDRDYINSICLISIFSDNVIHSEFRELMK